MCFISRWLEYWQGRNKVTTTTCFWFCCLFIFFLTHFRYSETYKMMDLNLTAKKIQIALVFVHSYAPRVKMLLHWINTEAKSNNDAFFFRTILIQIIVLLMYSYEISTSPSRHFAIAGVFFESYNMKANLHYMNI